MLQVMVSSEFPGQESVHRQVAVLAAAVSACGPNDDTVSSTNNLKTIASDPRPYAFDCRWGLDVSAVFGGGGYTCGDEKHRFSVAYASISIGASLELGSFKLACNKVPDAGLNLSVAPLKKTVIAGRSAAEWLFAGEGVNCKVLSAANYEKFGVAVNAIQLKPGVVIRWPDRKNVKISDGWVGIVNIFQRCS